MAHPSFGGKRLDGSRGPERSRKESRRARAGNDDVTDAKQWHALDAKAVSFHFELPDLLGTFTVIDDRGHARGREASVRTDPFQELGVRQVESVGEIGGKQLVREQCRVSGFARQSHQPVGRERVRGPGDAIVRKLDPVHLSDRLHFGVHRLRAFPRAELG